MGDGYGKEVDIWAVGCLYAEMMTGEPLFPGESDIDQLFQIVRVLGKLNSRHQNLITRNTMFKGMKQEQNTSLHQLFPDWNRDCLDFLAQCLKMDGNQRPDTSKLLKHDMFTKDKFVEMFLVELKGKLAQEMVGNPLLKRMPSYGSGRKIMEDKRITDKVSTKKSGDESKFNAKDKISQIGLSLLSTQLLSSTNVNTKSGTEAVSKMTSNNDDTITLSTLKQCMANPPKPSQKGISINNLVFKESGKQYRVLSAKPPKTSTISEKSSSTNFDVQIQPPSPAQFQSLQAETTNETSQQKRLSPVSINNLSISGNFPQYFSHKKSSNILGLHQVSQKANSKPSAQNNTLNTTRPTLVKRERPHIDLALMPLGLGTTPDSTKEVSPRILPPPPWLTSNNIKVTTQGKSTQIAKRSLTDWKSVGTITGIAKSNTSETNEFLLPNCPGAATSPLKGSRKKLSPMINFSDHLFGTPVSVSSYSTFQRPILLHLISEEYLGIFRSHK